MRKYCGFLLILILLTLSAFSITPGKAQAAPNWQPNVAYKVGDLVTYGGNTYRCLQSHTSLVGWEPPVVAALWQLQGTVQATNTPTVTPSATPFSALPDLMIAGISPSGQTAACSGPYSVQVTVKNIGTLPANAFVVSLVHPPTTLTQTVSGLGIGQSVTLAFSASGFGLLTATADSTNVIAESNENNNTLSLAVDPVPTPVATCTPTEPPATLTFTPTFIPISPTPTFVCTYVTIRVDPVTSPTNLLTQVITIHTTNTMAVYYQINGGSWLAFSGIVTLLPATLNHIGFRADGETDCTDGINHQYTWSSSGTSVDILVQPIDPVILPWSGNGVVYHMNDLVFYNSRVYRCLQSHTSQSGWSPEVAASLWQLQ